MARAHGDGEAASADRRTAVLDSALQTFARTGYRRTSMDSVAESAQISRPGLYFLFASKEELFREAVTQLLTSDLKAIEQILRDTQQPLQARLVAAFDRWAGRYVGPVERAVTEVIEDNAHLLGPITTTAPRRFARLVTDAVAAQLPDADRKRAAAVAQTLLSVSIGLKHQVDDRRAYVRRLTQAVELLAVWAPSGERHQQV